MKKVRFLFFIMMLSVVLFSCADSLNENEAILPDSYKEKLGTSGDDDDRYKQGEGAYIKDDPWSHGEITYDNYKSGEIWSFDVEKGQTYSIFMLNDSIKLHGYKYECELSCYKGSSKTEFDATAMQGVKNDFWYQHKYQGYSGENDLYSSPAVITATESGTVFLKIIPSHIDMETTSFNQTLPYSICVRKGRTEDSYVPLKCYGIPYSAWQHGELLFAIPNGWHDYIENTDSNWIDGYWYSVNVTKGVKYTLFIDEKGKSGNFTAQTTVNIVYYDAENNLQNVLPADYEYANNDGYREGYPFVAPITGTVLFAVYPENNAASNIGTFRLAVGTEDSYAPLSLDSWTYKYQYKPKNTSLLRVGRLFQPGTDFELKMYNGNTIPAEAITQWGWNSSTLTRWDTYLLCKEAGQSYLYCTYNGEDYYCNFTVAEKGSQTASFRIELPSAENFAVGNSISLKAKNGNSDITNSVTWKYADASSPDSDFTDLTSSEFPCEVEGEYYLFALYNDEIVFEKITVLPASSNPYNLALASGSLELFGSATFKLTKNGTDVSSSATWSCNDESVEFDAGTRTAIFYGGGRPIRIVASYGGIGVSYAPEIADSDTYNLTFSLPLEKIRFGSACTNVTLSGNYNEEKFKSLLNSLSGITNSFSFDMSNVSGVSILNRSDENSNDGLFASCSKLANLILPNSLTSLGVSCLRNCGSIESVTLPASLSSIENYVFANCSKLKSINIPDGVTTIGNSVLYGCSSLTSVSIPSSVTTIGSGFLGGCTSLTSVEIPNTVTNLNADSMFYNCTNLTTATIPSGVTSLKSTFTKCSNLKSVVLPSTVTIIDTFSFQDCSSLTSITIPSNTVQIGNFAFQRCSKITSIRIPASVEKIGQYAFSDCTKLSSVTFATNSPWYVTSNSAYRGGTKLSLATSTSNATYLKNTYKSSYWYLAELTGADVSWSNVHSTRHSQGQTITKTFEAQAGKKYKVFWKDSDNFSKDSYCDVQVAAYIGDRGLFYNNEQNGYTQGGTFTLTEDATVKISVYVNKIYPSSSYSLTGGGLYYQLVVMQGNTIILEME